MFKKFFLISCLFGVFFVFNNVSADGCEDRSTMNITLKNSFGDYIKDVDVKIFKQDGSNIGDRVASGNTDSYGLVSLSFMADNGDFVIQVDPSGSDDSSFYFYNESVSCDSTVTITKYLGGIFFKMYDMNDELIRDMDFSVYVQQKDAENNPVALDDYKVGDFDIDGRGSIMVYVPDETRSIDGSTDNDYLFKAKRNNADFFKYDITARDGEATMIEYYFSGMKLIFRDSDNVAFPQDVDIDIFEQYDSDTMGAKIDDVKTDNSGKVYFEYPFGTYVAVVDGGNGLEYFWDLEISDNSTRNYILKTGEEWTSDDDSCSSESSLNIKVQDLDGNGLKNIYYEIYKQGIDVKGNPVADEKIKSGSIGESGMTTVSFEPDPRVKYALSLYNNDYKDVKFWYYDDIQFECGVNKSISKYLPYTKIILRDTSGLLMKNQKFDIYTQEYDEDDNPVKRKKDKLGSFDTMEKGSVEIYLPSYHKYGDTHTNYVMTFKLGKAEYEKYNIDVVANENKIVEYVLEDIVINIQDAGGKRYSDETVSLYEQFVDVDSRYILGDKLLSGKTNEDGDVIFQYSSGDYAIVFDDDTGDDLIFWNIHIADEMRTQKELKVSSVRTKFFNSSGIEDKDVSIKIYSLNEDANGFYRGEKIESLNLEKEEDRDIILKSGPYLAVYENRDDDREYGKAFWVEDGNIYNISIYNNSQYIVSEGQHFNLVKPQLETLSEKLAGRVLLQVEEDGEVWYVDMDAKKRHYLQNGDAAYSIMRDFGLGISDDNLEKIPVGFLSESNGVDTDSDGISDKMEESLGLSLFTVDTDGDGYEDKTEINNGYNPNGSGKMEYDNNLVNKLKGRILLQVENRGEAWYLNPDDGKRYYMKDGNDAFSIMKYFSLGISNVNLDKIEIN